MMIPTNKDAQSAMMLQLSERNEHGLHGETYYRGSRAVTRSPNGTVWHWWDIVQSALDPTLEPEQGTFSEALAYFKS